MAPLIELALLVGRALSFSPPLALDFSRFSLCQLANDGRGACVAVGAARSFVTAQTLDACLLQPCAHAHAFSLPLSLNPATPFWRGCCSRRTLFLQLEIVEAFRQ